MKTRIKCTLADLGEVVGGATPSTKKQEFWDGDIPWLCPKDLTNCTSRYVSRGSRNITKLGFESCSTKLLPAGSILFSSRAPIGYIAIAKNSMCTNQGFKSIVPNENVDSLFMYYLLKQNKSNIENLGSGTTFKEVSASTMRNVEVEVPESLEEQTQIARILSAFDSKIEVNNKLNAKLEELLIALFHKLDFDCTGCEEAKIGDFCDVFTGKLNANQFDEDGQYPFFTCGENILKINSYIFDGPAIIISGNGSYTGRTNFYEGKFNLYQRTYACTPKEHLDENLIYALYPLIRTHLHEKISGGTHGSSIPYIVQGDITNFEFDFSLEKYVDFGKTSRRFLKQLQANSLENEKLSTLRDTLLPKLMRGELTPNT